jgi:hypothetical protein
MSEPFPSNNITLSGVCTAYNVTPRAFGGLRGKIAYNSDGSSVTVPQTGVTLGLFRGRFATPRDSPAGLGNRRSIASDSTGKYLVTGVVSDYIYTSLNYGVTWKKITSVGTGFWQTFASDSTGSILISGIQFPSGITRRSTDYGDTWLQTSTFSFVKIVSNSTGSIYFGFFSEGQSLIARSTNDGVTWNFINGIDTSEFSAINSTGSYVATSASRKVYVSTNGNAATPGSVVFTQVLDGNLLSPIITKWFDVKFNSTGNNLFLAGSTDSQNTFPHVIYKGVFSGGAWTFSSVYNFYVTFNRGLKIVCNSPGTIIIAVGVDTTNVLSVARSFDSGNSWSIKTVNIPVTATIKDFTSDATAQNLYLLIENTYIYTSTDYGDTWRASDTIAPLVASSAIFPVVTTTGFTLNWIGATAASAYTVSISPSGTTTGPSFTQYTGSGSIVYTGLDTVNTQYTVSITSTNIWGSISANFTLGVPAGTGYRRAVASSSDGTKLVTGKYYDYIYTSTDSGVTWVKRTGPGTGQWNGFASSSDGTKLVTGKSGGKIYTSITSGETWIQRDVSGVATGDWRAFASSSDGTKLVTGNATNGYIYTSTTSGETWIQRDVSGVATGQWNGFASSSDGTKLVTGNLGGFIYISTDSGQTWNPITGPGTGNWYGFASSSDGTKLITGNFGGSVYISTNSGTTWQPITVSGITTGYWYGFASNSDGTKLVTGNYGGYIYTSTDSGVNWVARTGPGTGSWYGFASSSDGTKLVATNQNSYIYTSTDSGVTWRASDTIAPLAPSSVTFSSTTGDLVVSWIGATGASSYSVSNTASAVITGPFFIPYAGSGSIIYTGLSAPPYTITITSINTWGNTATSYALNVPGAPTAFTGVSGNASAILSWTAPASNGTPIIGYTVTYNPGNLTATTAATTVTVTGLTNGTPYTFTVTATNAIGTGTASSPVVVTPGVPGAPTGVSAVAGVRSATVTWTAPVSNGGSAITGYTVTSSPGNRTATTTGATTATVTLLANGTSYTFTVTATNANGTGLPSSPSNSVTTPNVPGAPTDVTALAGIGTATVNWTAPLSNGGSAITEYRVTSIPGNITVITGASTRTAIVSGLTNGTSYIFLVTATNAAGTGAAGSVASVVPTSLGNWRGFAGSSDGTKLFTSSESYIYTSTDSGLTWVKGTRAPIGSGGNYTTFWKGFSSSSDGTKIITATYDTNNNSYGKIYTSTDSGVTWLQRSVVSFTNNTVWNAFTINSNGTRMIAFYDSAIYYSTNSGETWDSVNLTGPTINRVVSSSDGIRVVGTANGTNVYISTNYGTNFSPYNISGSAEVWRAIGMSSDGAKIVIGSIGSGLGGYIYNSTDYGQTWTPRPGIGTGVWEAFASSSDGTKIVTGNASNGYIYTSITSGESWEIRASIGQGYWYGFASSSDGVNLATGNLQNGYIYTSADSGVTWRASDTIAPFAPSSLTASAITTSGFRITWTGAAGATSYTYAILPNAGTYVATITSAGNGYVVYSGLTSGTTYDVTITAVNTWGFAGLNNSFSTN